MKESEIQKSANVVSSEMYCKSCESNEIESQLFEKLIQNYVHFTWLKYFSACPLDKHIQNFTCPRQALEGIHFFCFYFLVGTQFVWVLASENESFLCGRKIYSRTTWRHFFNPHCYLMKQEKLELPGEDTYNVRKGFYSVIVSTGLEIHVNLNSCKFLSNFACLGTNISLFF